MKPRSSSLEDSLVVQRVRSFMAEFSRSAEKRMFGGICFLLDRHMVCGVTGDETLMLRVGKDKFDEVLDRDFVRPMDFTGRPMKGFVYLEPPGYRSDEHLKRWLKVGVDFVSSLPPK